MPPPISSPGTRLAGQYLRRRALTSSNPPLSHMHSRSFSTSGRLHAKNQIYTSVRRPEDLHTYIMLSSSSRQPLITLWTASWCPPCKTIHPLIEGLIESGVGEAEGGVGFCTVEYDAPDIMAGGLGMTYMINSLPALLSFDAGEPQVQTKVLDGRQLADRTFLEEWIRNEARRQGNRGGGGGLFGRL